MVKKKLKTRQSSENVTISNSNSSHSNTEVKTYAVSESQGVYLCINAINKEDSCDFGLCGECYSKKAPSRNRSNRGKSYDEDASICNHKYFASLHQFFDKQFFAKDYIKQTENRNIRWSKNCSACGVKFVARNRNGTII